MNLLFKFKTGPDAKEAKHLAICRDAIFHVLKRIRDDSAVGYYLGFATESFSRLTTALALIQGRTQQEVEHEFHPTNAKDPREKPVDDSDKTIACGGEITITTSDILDHMEVLANVEVMELLREINQRFCKHCGADNRAAFAPCGCRQFRARRQG